MLLAPDCVTLPVPLMALVTSYEGARPLRLKTKAALLTTAPVPSSPVVVLLPICKIPAEIVVSV